MKEFLIEAEMGFISVLSAAISMGVLTDDAIIPHRYQHLATVAVGLILYVAYRRTPPKAMTVSELEAEVNHAKGSGTISFNG